MIPRMWLHALALLLLVAHAEAAIPTLVSHQGNLRYSGGASVADGTYAMTFRIYDVATEGTPLWEETRDVAVSGGLFQVALGQVVELGLSFDVPYWLGVQVGADAELSPRMPLTTAPYSFRAALANQLEGGVTAGMIVPDILSGLNGIRNDGGEITLVPGANVSITGNPVNQTITIAASDGSSTSYWQPEGGCIHYPGCVGIGPLDWFPGARLSVQGTDAGVHGKATSTENWPTFGGHFEAIGPSGRAVYGLASNTDNASNYGGYFEAAATSGTGVYALASSTGSANTGGWFEAHGAGGTGVYSLAPSTAAATNTGGRFLAGGAFGYGIKAEAFGTGAGTNYGVHALAAGSTGQGVRGAASNTGPGANYGGYFEAAGGQGRGVYGLASSGGPYPTYGGDFEASGSSGTGVRGVAPSGNYGGYFTAGGGGGAGVYGAAESSGDYANFGLYGSAAGTMGKGVRGIASNTGNVMNYGGDFETAGGTGRAVRGRATNTGTSSNAGGYFEAAGLYGYGVYATATNTGAAANYGGYFEAAGQGGRGVLGSAPAIGGDFNATNADGRAVIANAAGASGIGVISGGGQYDFLATGPGVDYGVSSSIRWKRDLRPIDSPLEKLLQIRGVYFTWDAGHGGRNDVGMIAEEVGRVLPEIVAFEPNGIDALGMDYGKLTPLLVEAVKALKREVDEQQSTIARLEQRLADLEATVAVK